MLLLTYSKWQDFHKVIQSAMEVYQNSGGEDADAIFMATLSRLQYPDSNNVNDVSSQVFLPTLLTDYLDVPYLVQRVY
jgi:hypothetical protein